MNEDLRLLTLLIPVGFRVSPVEVRLYLAVSLDDDGLLGYVPVDDRIVTRSCAFFNARAAVSSALYDVRRVAPVCPLIRIRDREVVSVFAEVPVEIHELDLGVRLADAERVFLAGRTKLVVEPVAEQLVFGLLEFVLDRLLNGRCGGGVGAELEYVNG